VKPRNLKGATVVITGASSGIGRATAEAFAREGARLVLAARDLSALKAVAARCRDLGAPEAKAVETDVTDSGDVKRLLSKAKSLSGRIDVWVSNVGVGAVGKFVDTPLEAHEQTIKTNLIGHITDAHAVVPVFIAQKRGTFINIISLGGYAPMPFATAYSASKFGLRGFSEALRAELSGYKDIHVCDVYPAFIDTPGVSHAANYTGAELAEPPPVFDAREVANAVVKLAKHPRDRVMVGWSAPVVRLFHFLSPALFGGVANALMSAAFKGGRRAPATDGNLYRPASEPGGIDGGYRRGNGSVALIAVVSLAAVVIGLVLVTRRRPMRYPTSTSSRYLID